MGMASEKLYRNTLEFFLLNEIFMAFRFFFSQEFFIF